MSNEIFEYRRQARGPRNYMALAIVMALLYLSWAQGWGLVSVFLCGPALGFLIARLIENAAEGFRMTEAGLDFYDAVQEGEVDWFDLTGVTIVGDGAGGSQCLLHLHRGATLTMPATGAFAPERLAEEFRRRGVPVWRTMPQDHSLALAS